MHLKRGRNFHCFYVFLTFCMRCQPTFPHQSPLNTNIKKLCLDPSVVLYLNFATKHCWNEHCLPVLPIFNDNHTNHGVHTGAAITSDFTKSLIVGYRYPGQYIFRNVETYRQSRFRGKKLSIS